ncbi:MAG: response regulator [Prolixibacteraceae bacterium]
MNNPVSLRSQNKITFRESLFFISLVIIGIVYIAHIWKDTKKQQNFRALQLGLSVESSLMDKNINLLNASPSDTSLIFYKQIKEKLHTLVLVNPSIQFAYYYLQRDGKLYFMVDSEPENSPDLSPPGQEFSEADPIDFKPFETGKAQITNPVTDRWGTWVSVEIPVFNQNKEVMATFGLDYDASTWKKELFMSVFQSGILVLITLILVITLRIIWLRNAFLKHEMQSRTIAESELRKLSKAIEQNPASVFITSTNGTIEYVNPKFTEITGYEPADVIGQNPRMLKSGKMDERIYSELWSKLSSGQSWNGELINKNKKGEYFWVHKSVSPIFNEQGKITNFISVAEDITERKRNEEALIKAKEKAEESDRLKSSFLANISHEIRTPMNGILGFADLLKTQDLSPENQKEFIDAIESSGERMLDIISNLVDISIIEAGEVIPKISEVNLNRLLQDIHQEFKPEFDKKSILLSCSTDLNDEQSLIKTDNQKLNQIIKNLINNSLKFTEKGQVEFGYLKNESKLEFFVKDTGVGIPENQKEYIFQSFRQGNIGLSKKYEGAGLGLTISKAYVEILEGHIWIDSEPHSGTTIFFQLPYRPAGGRNIEINIYPESSIQKFNINLLVVDDDQNSRLYLKSILQNSVNSVLLAKNGVEALEMVKSNPSIGLVLMDLNMPEMDGFEATRRIKKLFPEMPVIAQTAFAYAEDRDQALKAGCNDFITKPIYRHDLFNTITANLAKQSVKL